MAKHLTVNEDDENHKWGRYPPTTKGGIRFIEYKCPPKLYKKFHTIVKNKKKEIEMEYIATMMVGIELQEPVIVTITTIKVNYTFSTYNGVFTNGCILDASGWSH